MIPNNVTDLVQSIRDGEIGVIDQILIGDLVVSALYGLDAPETLTLTRRKIQSGADMATMAVEDIQTVMMDICLANPEISIDGAVTAIATGDIGIITETWRDKRDELRKIKENREIISITTQDDQFDSFIITGIYPVFDSDENWDAFFCSVMLEKVNIYGSDTTDDSLLAQAKEVVSGL